jgi:hypothetical protein
MVLTELESEVKTLSRRDKFLLLQFIISDLAKEEAIMLKDGEEYPIWSPYDAVEAAETLFHELQKAKTAHDQ